MLGVVIAACISLCPLIAAESMELPSLSTLSISLQHLNYPDYRPLPCSHSDCYCAAGVLQRASSGEFSAPTLLPGRNSLSKDIGQGEWLSTSAAQEAIAAGREWEGAADGHKDQQILRDRDNKKSAGKEYERSQHKSKNAKAWGQVWGGSEVSDPVERGRELARKWMQTIQEENTEKNACLETNGCLFSLSSYMRAYTKKDGGQHDGRVGARERERERERDGLQTYLGSGGTGKSRYSDAEKYPEYLDAFVGALPLAGATHQEGASIKKLGKGKQAETLKLTFVSRDASGEERMTFAVAKQFKKGRHTDFFLHNEYVALARLSSRPDCPATIPQVLGFDRHKARILVEFFDGSDLYSLGPPTSSVSRAALERVLNIWMQVADAVAFANRYEVFHSDVNPSNILVAKHPSDKVLLVDWACSRQEASLKTKVTNGKRGHYQPPELMKGEVGSYTDVFGVGSCLLWLLSGRTPAAQALVGQGRERSVADLVEVISPKLEHLECVVSYDASVGTETARGRGGAVWDVCVLLERACKEEKEKRVQRVEALMTDVHKWKTTYFGIT